MTSSHPRTPQSPSELYSAHDLPSKPATSPRTTHSLPTPAHSINGSMSSLNSGFAVDAMQVDESSNKRKRDVDDTGDQQQKKVHVEVSKLSIEDLHLDVGTKYKLCRTRKAPFYPPNLPNSGLVFQALFNSSPSQFVQNLVNVNMMRRTRHTSSCAY